jgi:outer membrane protein assembly factor BamA
MRPTLHIRENAKWFAAALCVCVLAFCGTARAQQETTLRKIEVLGLVRRSSEQIVQLSGLQLGQAIDARRIDAAADKLMQSGMFRRVSYRVRSEDYELTVIFELEEKPDKPVGPVTATGDVLGQVSWSGNRALSNQELSTAFALRSGDAAGRTQIDAALDAVRKAYARKGYVNAEIAQTSTRDAAARRVNYQFTITEGSQYKMGAFSVSGLPAADAQRLKSKWTLLADAIYDEGYLDQYRSTVIRPFVATLAQRTGARSKYEVSTKPDAQKQTVDVVVTFR